MRSRHRARGCRRHGHGRHHARPEPPTLRPRLIWFNLALTVAVMVLLVLDLFPLAFVFMVGAAIALIVNFPKLKSQADEIVAHALDRRRRVDGPRRRCAGRRAQRHRDGDGDGLVDHGSDPRRNGTLPRGHHGRAVDPVHVLHVERRVLLRHPAGAGRKRLALRHRTRRDGARLHHRAARASAEPARPGDLPVSLANVNLGDHHKKVLWRARVSLAMLAVGVLVG
jgi:CitMHS family citrate-Mg2+:H+ or citrate-Ca2+:H+ symporter